MPMEYSGEEQAICAMGLIRPRRGVFVEAIQYVLVLCTTVEVRDQPFMFSSPPRQGGYSDRSREQEEQLATMFTGPPPRPHDACSRGINSTMLQGQGRSAAVSGTRPCTPQGLHVGLTQQHHAGGL